MNFQWDFKELYKFADKLNEVSKLESSMKNAVKQLAKALLSRMKSLTPVGDTYELMNGWNGNSFAVKKAGDGFEVLIVNKTPYASAVNDGHRVRNRKDGEYYQVKRRVQVRNSHQWQNPVSDWYVYGHFFVERGILQMQNTAEIEAIIMRELQKWWDSI